MNVQNVLKPYVFKVEEIYAWKPLVNQEVVYRTAYETCLQVNIGGWKRLQPSRSRGSMLGQICGMADRIVM